MKKINLLPQDRKKSAMFTKILAFVRDFGLLIGLGLIIFFGYQGLFGESSALNLLKDNAIRMEERMKRWELQDRNNREQLEAKMAEVLDTLKAVESHRQHIGTTARKSYHPDMKGYTDDPEEQIKEAADLFSDYGLSD